LAPTPPETCTGGVACSGRFTSPDYIIEPCPVPTVSRLTRLSAASIADHQFDTVSSLFHDSSYTMSIFGEVRHTCCWLLPRAVVLDRLSWLTIPRRLNLFPFVLVLLDDCHPHALTRSVSATVMWPSKTILFPCYNYSSKFL
jgi:hypothetical protein